MKNKKAKILFWDIETSYLTGKTFSIWNTNINPSQIIQDWFIICGSWKFLGEKKVHHVFNSPSAIKKGNDKKAVKALAKAVQSADIIVGHNGDKFDLKKLKARNIIHGGKPISHIKTIDTLKVVRREFGFTSNRLDYVGKILGLGGKITNEVGLWDRVMEGDPVALKKMVKYCDRDVTLLEEVYLKLRPHMTNHPDLNVIEGSEVVNPCPNCASSNTIKNGKRPAMKIKKVFQKHVCNDCGTAFLGNKPIN